MHSFTYGLQLPGIFSSYKNIVVLHYRWEDTFHYFRGTFGAFSFSSASCITLTSWVRDWALQLSPDCKHSGLVTGVLSTAMAAAFLAVLQRWEVEVPRAPCWQVPFTFPGLSSTFCCGFHTITPILNRWVNFYMKHLPHGLSMFSHEPQQNILMPSSPWRNSRMVFKTDSIIKQTKRPTFESWIYQKLAVKSWINQVNWCLWSSIFFSA